MKEVIVGIDVSKSKLDLCIKISGGISQEVVLSNTISEIQKFFKGLLKEHIQADILICAEYTGHYIYPLSCVCDELKLDLWLENPYQIKHSSGLHRGKNDKLDSYRIAEYCNRFQDKARLFSLPDKIISSLKVLISERDMYISDRSKYQGQLTDQKHFMNKSDFIDKSKRLKRLLKELEIVISRIDKKIEELIARDDTLSHQHQLLCSIDGVGTKIATKMLVATNGFKDFDNARSFCCHAGVAPFAYTSGSSIHSKNKVSFRADKSIKALLHLAALTVATVKKEGEMKEYYLRKVAAGKNKMSVLNAIRAKLVLRMFAVIRENRIYEKKYNLKS